MTKLWTYCAVAIVIACPALAAHAQEVAARAWIDSTSYLVGDWITVHVELKHPAGMTFQPLLGDTLNGFSVVRRPALRSGGAETLGELFVARYDSGRAILPPIQFGYRTDRDTAFQTVSTNPLVLTVRTVEVDTAQAFKDVKPPLSIALSLAEVALYAGALLILAVIAYLAYRYWKKKQERETGEVYIAPPRPAHVIALEELGALKEKKLWQQGLIKQYYSEATEIVRRYFENRYHIMALEQTTDEIMHALHGHIHADGISAETAEILRLADLVKFAKFQPGLQDHERMLTVAYDIVDRTKQGTIVQSQFQAETADVGK